jgi:opacity protein-like surface antigen
VITERTTHTDNFAIGAGFGFLWDMTDSLGLDVGYRYLNLGEVRVQGFPTGETLTADKMTAHDVQVGLIYKF